MSESVAKATRRDLRRAMGSAAVDRVVLHERAIEDHTETLRILSKQIVSLERDLAALRKDHDAATAHGAAFIERPWRDRLRWLLTGR